jgi:hypothetical protein
MRGRWLRLSGGLAVALAAASCLSAGAQAAPAIGGFSVRPAEINPANPVTRAYFVPTVAPGQGLTQHVVVTNSGSTVLRLRVYGVDGLTGVTSGAVYANRGVRVRKAGRWVRPAGSLVTIAPRAQRQVAFTIRVPRSAAAGDHLAGIAFENAVRPRRSRGRFAVIEVLRSVVGVEIEVPGRAQPRVRLQGMSFKALPGTEIPSVLVGLANSGGRLCKPTLALSLGRPGGRTRTVVRRLDTILPGDAIPYPFPWPTPLKAGSYALTARASACGARQTLHRTARLGRTLGGTSSHPGLVAASAPASTSGTPWLPIIAVGLGGVAAGALLAMKFARTRVTPNSGH